MNKFDLAEILVDLLDGEWASEKNEIIRANVEECDGSIELTIGKKKFALSLKEII